MKTHTKISEEELNELYKDSDEYLLKPWRTRSIPEAEPLIVGGEGAYEELLGIFKDVGKEAMDLIRRAIEKLEKGSSTIDDFTS